MENNKNDLHHISITDRLVSVDFIDEDKNGHRRLSTFAMDIETLEEIASEAREIYNLLNKNGKEA